MTALMVAFLLMHGLLHLAIWLPHPSEGSDRSPPFHPEHSLVLTAVAPAVATRRLAITLAASATAAYSVAGIALAVSASWVVGAAVVAACLGLLLKLLFFHPWLSVGVLLDVGVLFVALV